MHMKLLQVEEFRDGIRGQDSAEVVLGEIFVRVVAKVQSGDDLLASPGKGAK